MCIAADQTHRIYTKSQFQRGNEIQFDVQLTHRENIIKTGPVQIRKEMQPVLKLIRLERHKKC